MSVSTTLREYAVQAICDRLQKTADLIGAVRSGDDPISIKKMRVASRRLRAALQVFASEFPGREFVRFERDVKFVADALAEARDLDVMIDAVNSDAKAISEDERAWIDLFIDELKGDRARIQVKVLKALSFAEKRDMVGRFQELTFIQNLMADTSGGFDQSDSTGSRFVPDPIAQSFGQAITGRMSELVSFEPIIENPAKVAELHKMRIAAKRLRYTLELYVGHAGDRITPYIDRIKTVQEYLGNIHDADVLVPRLCEHLGSLLHASRGAGEIAGAYMADFAAMEGLVRLCRNKQAERERAYRDFQSEWRKMRTEGYFDSLWSTVKSELPISASIEPNGERNGG